MKSVECESEFLLSTKIFSAFIWEIYEHIYECMHAQLHLTLQPHGLYSLPDSVVHELFRAKILRVGFISIPGDILAGSNLHLLHLLHWQVDFLPLHHLGSPYNSFTMLCWFYSL